MSAILRRSTLIALLPVILVGCEIGGAGDAGGATVSDSAGVTIVENRGSDRPLGRVGVEVSRLVPPATPRGPTTALPGRPSPGQTSASSATVRTVRSWSSCRRAAT